MVDDIMGLDNQQFRLMIWAFRQFKREQVDQAMDITAALKTIEEDMQTQAYAMGFLTKITEKINEEWICRNPQCKSIVKATDWLRNVKGLTEQEILAEHGQFFCPRCGDQYRPWKRIYGDHLDAHGNLVLVPANKALVIKANDASMAQAVGNSVTGRNGEEYMIMLIQWPENSVDKMWERMKLITANLVGQTMTPGQLSQKIMQTAKDQTVGNFFRDGTMSVTTKQRITNYNATVTAKNMIRLDLAERDFQGRICFDYTEYEYRTGQTHVMDQDELLQYMIMMQTQVLASTRAASFLKQTRTEAAM